MAGGCRERKGKGLSVRWWPRGRDDAARPRPARPQRRPRGSPRQSARLRRLIGRRPTKWRKPASQPASPGRRRGCRPLTPTQQCTISAQQCTTVHNSGQGSPRRGMRPKPSRTAPAGLGNAARYLRVLACQALPSDRSGLRLTEEASRVPDRHRRAERGAHTASWHPQAGLVHPPIPCSDGCRRLP